MKDIVLINSPMQEYSKINNPTYSTTAPLGLGYLATIASREGYNVEIIDAEAEKLSSTEVTRRVKDLNPEVVGINIFSTNYRLALDILENSSGDYKLVGGPHATLRGEELRGNYTVVKGEADGIFSKILEERPRGLVNAGLVQNLDSLPNINRKFFINDPYFLNDGKIEASINSSRGCSFSCVYCSVPTISGRKMRARSIENVVSEIEELAREGVNSIHFTDDLFNFSKDRIMSLTKAMCQSGANLSWRALCRVENLDEDILRSMRGSGCYRIAIGVESATPRVLRYIGKSPDVDKTRYIFDLCRKLGIETKAFFTIGHPDESKKEIEDTIDFAIDLNPDDARFMVVRAFPGTRLYKNLEEAGYPREKLDDYAQSKIDAPYVKYHVMNNMSLGGVSPKELDEYIIGAYHRFSRRKE
jgi:radical SAM superfamily enzyme YgiQ (UPF0313 family)